MGACLGALTLGSSLTSTTGCVRWQPELGDRALCPWARGRLAMVAVQPWLPCCERSCADSSVLPWKSLMREVQMGSLGIE